MGIIDTANILYNFTTPANNQGKLPHETPQLVTYLPDTAINSFQLGMNHSVADLCREQNISAADLAARSGLEEGRVTAIALGRWTPSPTERQKIAAVFNVVVDQIAWGHKTPIQHLYGHGPG